MLKNEGKQIKTSFSHSLLNKEKVLPILFLAYLFQDHDRAMAFLQERALSQSSMLCTKCANPMKMCRTQCGVNECIWRCYRIQLVHGNMRCSKLSLGKVMLPIYDSEDGTIKGHRCVQPKWLNSKQVLSVLQECGSGEHLKQLWEIRSRRKGGWIWWKQIQEKKIQQRTQSKVQWLLKV